MCRYRVLKKGVDIYVKNLCVYYCVHVSCNFWLRSNDGGMHLLKPGDVNRMFRENIASVVATIPREMCVGSLETGGLSGDDSKNVLTMMAKTREKNSWKSRYIRYCVTFFEKRHFHMSVGIFFETHPVYNRIEHFVFVFRESSGEFRF